MTYSKNESSTRKTDLQSNEDKQDCITTTGNGTDGDSDVGDIVMLVT